jgi:hypothetical protein
MRRGARRHDPHHAPNDDYEFDNHPAIDHDF